MKFILDLARPEIREMTPYSSARREQMNGKVWLNANENPWSNSEDSFNRYPEPQPQDLLNALAKLYHVIPEQLLVGRGSDEIIDLLLRVFCTAGKDAIMICPPTYGMYKIAAVIQNAGIVSVPLLKEQNFSLDMPAILQAWQPRIKLIFLCSPNNPTGNVFAEANVLSLCQQFSEKALIIVDEAYIEFSNAISLTKHINDYPNLVIMRTLSKSHGLAGVRCGSVIANPTVIQLLQKVIAPYPIPVPVAKIITEYLTPDNFIKMQQCVEQLKQQRKILENFLSTLPAVKKLWPSDANFLLMEVDDAELMMQQCQAYGIVIRDRSRDYGLKNCIRITIGTPEENQLLMKILRE